MASHATDSPWSPGGADPDSDGDHDPMSSSGDASSSHGPSPVPTPSSHTAFPPTPYQHHIPPISTGSPATHTYPPSPAQYAPSSGGAPPGGYFPPRASASAPASALTPPPGYRIGGGADRFHATASPQRSPYGSHSVFPPPVPPYYQSHQSHQSHYPHPYGNGYDDHPHPTIRPPAPAVGVNDLELEFELEAGAKDAVGDPIVPGAEPPPSGVYHQDDDNPGTMEGGTDIKSKAKKSLRAQQASNLDLLLAFPRAVRARVRRLVLHPAFDRLVLIIILLNCVILALDTPNLDSSSSLGKFVSHADVTFVVLFTLEAVLKIIALGVVNRPTSYFRDTWNVLDFIIVLEGLISLTSSSDSSLSGLRTLRVLRPLRTISRLTGLRILVRALLRSLPMLCSTLVVCAFYFIVFGIIGLQVWQGKFKNRCFFIANGKLNEDVERLCGGIHTCDADQFCAKWVENPNFDVTSFDNILWSFLTIFTSITLEGWVNVMYAAMDTTSAYVWVYFVALILFGAFILMNLTLAVIMTKFREATEEQEREEAEMARRIRLRAKRKRAEIERRRAILTMANSSARSLSLSEHAAMSGGGAGVGGVGGGAGGGGGGGGGGVNLLAALKEKQEKEGASSTMAPRRPASMKDLALMKDLLSTPVHDDLEPEKPKVALSAEQELIKRQLAFKRKKNAQKRRDAESKVAEQLEKQLEEGRGRVSSQELRDTLKRHAAARGMRTGPDGMPRMGRSSANSLTSTRSFSLMRSLEDFSCCGWVNRDWPDPDDPDLDDDDDGGLSMASTATGSTVVWYRRRKRCSARCRKTCGPGSPLGFKLQPCVRACISAWKWFSDLNERIISTNAFKIFITVMILVNTLALALDHHGISSPLEDIIFWINTVCTFVFILELVMKLAGLGVKRYFEDAFNRFDFVIVVLSIVELGLGGGGTFSAFRSARIFRIIKLVRYLKSMQMIMRVISKSLSSFFYIGVLLLLFCFIYSVLGMQLFGGTFEFEGEERPRNNFDSLHLSFITVFQVLAGEAWNEVMYIGVRATSPAAALYFVSWVVIGQFILLNLFLAVLLDNFSQDDGEEEEDGVGQDTHRLRDGASDGMPSSRSLLDAVKVAKEQKKVAEAKSLTAPPVTLPAPDAPPLVRTANFVKLWQSRPHMGDESPRTIARNVNFTAEIIKSVAADARRRQQQDADGNGNGNGSPPSSNSGGKDGAGVGLSARRPSVDSMLSILSTLDKPTTRSKRHLFMFAPEGKFSTWCRNLVSPTIPMASFKVFDRRRELFFDNIILFLILLSSITLAVEGPPDSISDDTEKSVLFGLEIAFTVLFTLEIVIKAIAWGFVMNEGAYLRNGWNVVDFVVVLSSLLNLALTSLDLGFVRTLRLLRCLRPLRVISRNQGMKVVVNALFMSITGIVNVAGVLLLIWLMFAILGVQLFAGRLGECSTPDFPPDRPKSECTGEWSTPQPHFDNVLHAMLTLYITSSGEGWPDVMFRVGDATGVDRSGSREASPWNEYYFVVFVCIGGFFFLNLFLGVVFDNFMRLKKEYDSFSILTEEQREWVATQRKLAKSRPERALAIPFGKRRRRVFWVVNSNWFEGIVMVAIVLNVAALASTHDEEPPELQSALFYLNLVFTVLFVLEAVLKIYGRSWRGYITDSWNRFDFFVVVCSLLDLALEPTSFKAGQTLAKIFRIFRVMRVLRLVKNTRGLRRLLMTLWSTLPSLVNVGSLLLLLFFIFSILGMQVCGNAVLGEDLNDHANFQDFFFSLLTLFRISTGEGWEGIMFDCQDNSGGSQFSAVYFVMFVTIAQFVMLNLFIMIIVEEFEAMDRERHGMTDDHIDVFRTVWSVFDPAGTKYIKVTEVEHLLRSLPLPLGIPPDASTKILYNKIKAMTLKSWGNNVHFRDLLLAVHRTAFGNEIPMHVMDAIGVAPERIQEKIGRSISRKAKRSFSLRSLLSRSSTPDGSGGATTWSLEAVSQATAVTDVLASVAIQRAFRRWQNRALAKKKETAGGGGGDVDGGAAEVKSTPDSSKPLLLRSPDSGAGTGLGPSSPSLTPTSHMSSGGDSKAAPRVYRGSGLTSNGHPKSPTPRSPRLDGSPPLSVRINRGSGGGGDHGGHGGNRVGGGGSGAAGGGGGGGGGGADAPGVARNPLQHPIKMYVSRDFKRILETHSKKRGGKRSGSPAGPPPRRPNVSPDADSAAASFAADDTAGDDEVKHASSSPLRSGNTSSRAVVPLSPDSPVVRHSSVAALLRQSGSDAP